MLQLPLGEEGETENLNGHFDYNLNVWADASADSK